MLAAPTPPPPSWWRQYNYYQRHATATLLVRRAEHHCCLPINKGSAHVLAVVSFTAEHNSMDNTTTSVVVWFAIAIVSISTLIFKVVAARGRGAIADDPAGNNRLQPPLPPPVVTGTSVIGLLHTLVTKGFRAMVQELYTKLGSVFTVSLLGMKTTFLIGPEVLSHFYQGLESEISHGKHLEFTVPMFGNEVGYGVDIAIRMEQNRFYLDALKPPKLRCHVGLMLQEVEVYVT